MASVFRLVVSPDDNAKITVLEGLRDFADATSGWSYLEDTSRHYAEEKAEPAAVLRRRVDGATFVDFAFADSPVAPSAVELVLVTQASPTSPFDGEERADLLRSFRNELQAHLERYPMPLSLHVAREEVEPAPQR